MMKSPAAKATITAAAMMVTALIIDHYFKNNSGNLQYLTYLVYAAGIAWVMIPFAGANNFNPGFGQLFSAGFRCFIVVTLLMVVFTYVFLRLKPEIRQQAMAAFRNEWSKQPDLTPAEAEKNLTAATKYFDIMMISMAIFGYLFTGALLTALTALGIRIFHAKNDTTHQTSSITPDRTT
jgi:hypothetical protein